MKRPFFRLCLLVLLVAAASSCRVQQRLPNNYLEQLSDTTGQSGLTVPDPVIQKNDLLSIQVYSASLNPEVDAAYNLPVTQGANVDATLRGFLVNAAGNIEHPRLGIIAAEGLTKAQLAARIRERLQGQLTDPTVIIRFLNYRVTVLGEVGNPGTFNVPTERVTLLEALGLAGDVTEFGKKTNVKILREGNGDRQIGVVDLTSEQMFASPFYQLQHNDVVFVQQTRQRVQQRDRQDIGAQIGIATSILTSIALILNLIR